jgi:sec-independent protein translocase protein TatC
MTNDNVFPVMEHLVNLRKRLIVIAVAVTLAMGLAWNFSPGMLVFIEKPLTGKTYLTELKTNIYAGLEQRFPDFYHRLGIAKESADPKLKTRQLNYSAPMEPFFVQCKLSLMTGFILVLPVVFHQVWLLVTPLLKLRGRLVIPFVVSATFAFCVGATFFLRIVWPVIINFSLSYEAEGLQSWFGLSAYVDFCLRLILIFGFIFELPVATLLLSRLGLINGTLLARNRKYALLASAIISAFHADLLTMFVIMVPLYLMYETSVWVAFIFGRKRLTAASVSDSAFLGQPVP